jgi:hypothetical protein
MDVADRRLQRLGVLLKEHKGNKAALARTLGKAPAQVTQWFAGTRKITERSAREIERRADRAEGWLDASDEQIEAYRHGLVLNDALNALGPTERKEAISFVAFLAQRAGKLHVSEKLARYLKEDDEDKSDD